MNRVVRLITLFAVLFTASPAAPETFERWKNMSGEISSREFNCIAADPGKPGRIYAGTANGAYKSQDGGKSWQRIFRARGERKNIRYVYISEERVYVCTDEGLFISSDNGRLWKRPFGLASRGPVYSVATLNEGKATVIAAERGLFMSKAGEKRWNRIFPAGGKNNGNTSSVPVIRTIAPSHKSPFRFYIGTEDGIFFSENSGAAFKRFSDLGLPDKGILALSERAYENDTLYAVTKIGVYYYDQGWHVFEDAKGLVGAKSIAFGPEGDNSVWAATKRGVYKLLTAGSGGESAAIEAENLLNYFNNEPAISEVQEKAIVYAEVHPNKIANWRRRANMRAILPRLSLGIDHATSDNYKVYTSSSTQYVFRGPDGYSDGWDLTLTWDLGNLIWNDDQAAIDGRSKLMVQLRDDILDEVNSYYYERRKLQIELLEVPPDTKRQRLVKELRIQELTANLDALTGGYFSRSLRDRY